MPTIVRTAAAELLGTFLLVFLGTGALLTDGFVHGAIGWTGVALVFGLSLALLVTALAPAGAGYFNPAVTLGAWAARKTTTVSLVVLVAGQLLGAALAGWLLRALFPSGVWMANLLASPVPMPGIHPFAALMAEFVLTFFLMLVFLGTRVDAMAPKLSGFPYGLAYAVGVLMAGPLTGGVMNPARAFGSAAAAGFLESHWIYWVGPAAGACVASWLYTRYLSQTI